MLVPFAVVRVWGSATSRPYADICAVILRIPRIISFANEDYPAPSYCGTPSPDFFVYNQKVGGSGGSVVQYPSRPRQLWVLLNHLLNFSGGSVALLGGSLPASEKSRFSLVVQNARLVVQWWFTFLLKNLIYQYLLLTEPPEPPEPPKKTRM
ncbi:TPA: hypothetical protein U6I94_001987 [Klebsiella pneumoniae]|nr:hypothetical protein [Klebsiella pneumoniae]